MRLSKAPVALGLAAFLALGAAIAWFGLASQPGGEETPMDAEALLRRADEAMYRVKRQGGNGIEAG